MATTPSSPGPASGPDYAGPSFGAPAEERRARVLAERALVKEAVAGGLSTDRRERVRQAALAAIPRWYRPWGHLAATTGVGLATLALSVFELRGATVRASDWLVVPLVCLLSNFFEWRVHKVLLHRRQRFFEVVYDKHTPMHHVVFLEDDMALRSAREFRLVLMPAFGIAGIVVASAPFAVAVAKLWSPVAGWLALVTMSLYLVSYEVLHLAYHAPAASFVGRLGLVRALRRHHARHHDPRLMQRWNFNVTVPLFDWVMGTVAPKKR